MVIIRKSLQIIGINSIQTQLLLLNLILVLSGFTAMTTIYYGMEADAATINTAGRQRMLSQRVAKDVLFVNAGFEQKSQVNETIEQFESAMKMLLNGDEKHGISAPMTPEIKEQLNKVNGLWHEYREGIDALVQANGTELRSKHSTELTRMLHQRTPIILKEMNQAVKMMEVASNASVNSKMHTTLGLILLLMLLSGIIYRYIFKFLMTPLLPLREALKMFAKGDLTKQLPADDNDDEISALYTDYNEARKEVSKILESVTISSEQLNSSSLQLKKAAMENASGMDLQYQEIELISTAMNEITATIKNVADSSANTLEYTNRAEQDTNNGRKIMAEAATAVIGLNQQVQSVGLVINTLNDDSINIKKVLDVINDIADQTNLLALNAAIEAARAGDAGRGFSVVADEVRGLAGRTANSTSEIKKMVDKLQDQTNQAVQAINIGQQQATTGVEYIQQADEALERIVKAVVAINEMNSHIATATREESEVANDMNQRIVHVADKSNKTRFNAKNNQELAEHLSEVGEALHNHTVRFKI